MKTHHWIYQFISFVTDSSDDDKIVKYLWEEMSGPLQDHTLQDDKNMLTLKDLVPGNYIFK